MIHSFTFGRPSVGAYCNASVSASEATVVVISFEVVGEVAVNDMDVKGNISSFGFPGRREMTPGVLSSGSSARTGVIAVVR